MKRRTIWIIGILACILIGIGIAFILTNNTGVIPEVTTSHNPTHKVVIEDRNFLVEMIMVAALVIFIAWLGSKTKK